jgi:hypothetical protein
MRNGLSVAQLSAGAIADKRESDFSLSAQRQRALPPASWHAQSFMGGTRSKPQTGSG